MKIQDYQQNKPNFSLFDYFQGKTRGWGMFQDRGGNLKRQFVVDINGYTNDQGQLVLEEDFVWSDGEKSRRVWTISKDGNNQFIGKADDVIGEAKGVSAGNALNWKYDLSLPVDGKTYKVRFDDWMFLQPDGVLLNRAKMSKFGFNLGEVFISFKK
ncbi:DUF3833 domain-containing protein [uncultured Cocleimonas sp.]|uniref:DUF3833 domain-containing protein n=1 Tax=uncultured Cocleimonas sp. TaxID=1051587 RepID=UPI00260EB458|nr:DUF3833 domain-containing protein [uncultured Cocleimonas sp.]